MPTSALRKNLTSMGEFLRNRSIIIWILVHRAPKLKWADVGIGPYGVSDKSQFVFHSMLRNAVPGGIICKNHKSEDKL